MKVNHNGVPRVDARRAEENRSVVPGDRRAGRSPGRAWIGSPEVGGADPRYAHLAVSHD